MMGKSSKKVKRQVQKKADELKIKACQGKEAVLETAFKNEDYAKVLELLAELITSKDIKPELLYKGAYSYFMLGDYERAAQWVTNTLNYAPDDVDTRILLARLCFIQNRHDDGLAIYDFLIEHYRATMSEEQKGQIIDSSEYYVRREAEKLRTSFPHLADFLSVGPEQTASPTEAPIPPQPVARSAEGGTALSALQRLKAKLQAIQEKDKQDEVERTAGGDRLPHPALPEAESINEPMKEQPINVSDKIAEIESQECSLREKVQLLNKFAAGEFMAEAYAEAEAFLTAALKIDAHDNQTLKNMALTQVALGHGDKAQAVAATLPEADFMLLKLLKDMENG